MSRGVLDQAALDAAERAVADAGKRGLRVVSITSVDLKAGRSFVFGYEPVARVRRPRQAVTPPVKPPMTRSPEPEAREVRIRRGGATQGALDL